MPIYKRHLRYGSFDRVRHSTNLLSFLNEQATKLTGTGTGKTVTFVNASNTVALNAHGLEDGHGPLVLVNDGGALPAELSADVLYWAHVIDVDSFTLHLTQEGALDDSGVIAFTTDGSGTSTVVNAITEEGVYNLLKSNTAEQVQALAALPNV